MRIESWEFLFAANLVFPILIPFLFPKSVFANRWVFFVLALLPQALGLAEHLITQQGDLEFFLLLSFLHWDVSLFCLILLWEFVPLIFSPGQRKRFYFGMIFLSAVVSLGSFAFRSSLVFMDPFWGIVPGSISLDPIISLEPYWLRFGISLLIIAVLIQRRSSRSFLPLFWALLFLAGFFIPSPFLSNSTLKRHFHDEASEGPITVRVENPTLTPFHAKFWAHEFAFYFSELKSRLPESARLRPNTRFQIFIYATDDSKAHWIGARSTEIGNFFRGEMHLSSVRPGEEPLLPHELTHLIHGALANAPLRSYLDPFIFEGLAVSLAANDFSEALGEGAAVTQVLPPRYPARWPRRLRFYWDMPVPASYALAGAYAAHSLENHLWPWEKQNYTFEDLKNSVKPSEAEMELARKIFEFPPLLKNPLFRDCSRLEWQTYNSPTLGQWKKFQSVCPNSKSLLKLAFKIARPDQRLEAIGSLSTDEARGDFALLQNKYDEAEAHYQNCKEPVCVYKAELASQKILIANLGEVLGSEAQVLSLFENRADALERLLRILPIERRIDVWTKLAKIRKLSDSETRSRARDEFYLNAADGKAREAAQKILKQIKFPETSEAQAFKRRLEWELK